MTSARGLALALALGPALACRQGPPSEGGAPAGACPDAWLQAPVVDESIAVPAGNGHVVFHAAAKGSQNYACGPVTTDGGSSYAWSLTGPEATLDDCHAATMGRHFASDAGGPEWQTLDGAYVVGRKIAASKVDSRAVPWLLLSVDAHGGAGTLTGARYVQRVRTVGGVAPATRCDASRAGTTEKVPYAADYFFYAP